MTNYYLSAREPSCEVYCSQCGIWYEEDEIQFLNIEEDISGRDLLTFSCNRCGSIQTSLVRGNR
jgi:Zn finger protein HypA/HybF involved in hydrogenase expression